MIGALRVGRESHIGVERKGGGGETSSPAWNVKMRDIVGVGDERERERETR